MQERTCVKMQLLHATLFTGGVGSELQHGLRPASPVPSDGHATTQSLVAAAQRGSSASGTGAIGRQTATPASGGGSDRSGTPASAYSIGSACVPSPSPGVALHAASGRPNRTNANMRTE